MLNTRFISAEQALLWLAPLLLPLLGFSTVTDEAAHSSKRIFCAGIALQSILLVMVGRRAFSTQNHKDESRQLVLRSTWLLITEIGIVTAVLMWQAEWGWWLMLTPITCWILAVFYLPFLADSTVILQTEPESCWLQVFGLRLAFKDPGCPALWVRMESFDFGSIGYTPNLGHYWGPFVLSVFLVLIAAMPVFAVLAM